MYSHFEAVMESFRIWAHPISNFYYNSFSPLGNILSTIPLYSPPHHICKNPRDDFYCNFRFGPTFGFRRRESPVLIEVVGDCTQRLTEYFKRRVYLRIKVYSITRILLMSLELVQYEKSV